MTYLSDVPFLHAAVQSTQMLRRPATSLSVLTAVTVLAMAGSPAAALAEAPSGDGDMYQPWVPDQPRPEPKPEPVAGSEKATPARGYAGSQEADVVVATSPQPKLDPKPKAAGTKAAKHLPVVKALPAASPSLDLDPGPAPGPSQAPVVAAMALACLGCAWLLRPRRS